MTSETLHPERRQAIAEALEAVPFAKLLGISIIDVSEGLASLSLKIRPEFLQNHGVVHGGVIAALIDTAAAFAVVSILDTGETTTTIDLTVHYLYPLTEGVCTAHAKLLRTGKRVLVLSVEVNDEDQRIVATATTAFLRRRQTIS